MARIGIIGTGWGLMHLGAFRAAGAEVVGLCGRDAEKTRAIAEREGVALSTIQPGELIEAVEIVVVASPPETHGAFARHALEAGRHVLCEKPIARSALEAEALAAFEADLPDLVTAVNFPMRRLAPLVALRDAIAAGHIGALRSVTATVTHGFGIEPATEDGLSPSGDFGGASHPIDAALWFAGDTPERVTGAFTGGVGRGMSLLAAMVGGAAISVTFGAGFVAGIRGVWRIVGEEAEASFEAGYEPSLGGWVVSDVRVGSEVLAEGVSSDPGVGGSDPWFRSHVALARDFLDAVAGGDRSALPTFADGARAQRALVAAADSACSGRCAEI